MPNHRKFRIGDVAYYSKPMLLEGHIEETSGYAAIVDYRKSGMGRGYYRIVRLLHPRNGAPYAESVWMETGDLEHTSFPQRNSVVSRYNANRKLVSRGCECNCCAHEAIPVSEINKDGTFKWEDMNE